MTARVKYQRTYHLPWSPGLQNDDRVMEDLSGFGPEDLVVTVKMDGECTTMYRDYIHARSIDWHPHPSRTWIKGLHAQIAHEIPEGWRICGENLWARHSIHYRNLRAYFLVFSVWNKVNECLSWPDTELWAKLLGLETVPVLGHVAMGRPFYGMMAPEEFEGDPCEGYVLRVRCGFSSSEYKKVVGKWVRKGHVQTNGHWMREAVVRNELRKEKP